MNNNNLSMVGIDSYGDRLVSRLTFMLLFILMALFMSTPSIWALANPAAGTFAYDVYDIGVLQMLQGPIGFVAGAVAVVIGAVAAIIGRVMLAIPAILGGAILLKADTIVNSMGAII